MVEGTLTPDTRVIVEQGPGTGAFTREILDRKSPDARLIAIESNRHMARVVREQFPEVCVYEDSVENLREILRDLDIAAVDCVISSLPWAFFSDRMQDRILDVTLSALAPNATFATFAYIHGLILPVGRRLRTKLKEHFPSVSQSAIVWWNLLPAFVYRCAR
jgi:phosphatidylethanolamine/phosphatidyl-N-methylethanolamine N-methyltransferase